MTETALQVRVGKRGVVVIPKKIREALGIDEGTILKVRVEARKVILEVFDLWAELRSRGRSLERADLEKMEKELDEVEEKWLDRVRRL